MEYISVKDAISRYGKSHSTIKKAIYNLYGIMPKSVNVINQMGKYRRLGRSAGRTKNWKKAVVILPKGKFIDVYTNV